VGERFGWLRPLQKYDEPTDVFQLAARSLTDRSRSPSSLACIALYTPTHPSSNAVALRASLSLSLSLTHTLSSLSYTHTQTYTHTYTHTLSLKHTQSSTHTLFLSNTHIHTLSQTHTYSHIYSFSFFLSLHLAVEAEKGIFNKLLIQSSS
jgi:hypothetical protein